MIYINDCLEDFSVEAALPLLSEQRRQKVMRFSHDQGRCQSAAAFVLLCEGLRKEYGIEEPPLLDFGPHGKPFIAARPDIHFSLSHCPKAALCALSDRPVGADIERIATVRPSLVAYTMNDDEQRQISLAARPDIEFMRLWTMKESLLKLTGEGIRSSLKDVLKDVGGQVVFTTVVNLHRQHVYTICTQR